MAKFGIVFPGQGSQRIGMLAELGETCPTIKSTFKEASSVLGYDLWALTQTGSLDELSKTWKTQPALLAASVAVYRVWKEAGGGDPIILSGHSLGEYSALVCGGVIDFEDAIKLVESRGKLMQEAAPEGSSAMYAILGLSDEDVIKACQDTMARAGNNQVVSPVNFNAPGQVVIAGHVDAVRKAAEICQEMGAKRALLLPVSVPSHCILMKPAAEKLEKTLEKINLKPAKLGIMSNVDAKVQTDLEYVKAALVRQLYSPVLWTSCVLNMAEFGAESLIEMGAGNVLTGLNKRIVASVKCMAVSTPASLEMAVEVTK